MPGFHLDLSSLVGSVASGAAVVLLAKLHLQKALRDLETVINEMQLVQRDLATFAIRLERIQKLETMLHAHEKKIAVLESTCINLKSKI